MYMYKGYRRGVICEEREVRVKILGLATEFCTFCKR